MPSFSEAWNNLGTVLITMGKPEAAGVLLTAIQLNKNYEQAYYNLSTAT
jgi:hypothetical protein